MLGLNLLCIFILCNILISPLVGGVGPGSTISRKLHVGVEIYYVFLFRVIY
jgi:hypothetical protein